MFWTYFQVNVTFVENYSNLLPILKKNILNLSYQHNSIIIEKNINDNLNLQIFKKKFDIIFIDPPYKEKKIIDLLIEIIEFNILSDNGVVILHRHKKEKDKLPEKFNIIEEKNYGVSKIIFGTYI